jgi:predicted Zn-dependent protease
VAQPASAPAGNGGSIAPSDTEITAQRKDSDTKLSQGDAPGAESESNQVAAKEMVKVAIAQMAQGKLNDAEKELNDAAARDPKQSLVYYNMGVLRLKQGRTDEALKQFEASFLNGFNYFDEMAKDPDLDAIRNDPRFIALVKKYRTTV